MPGRIISAINQAGAVIPCCCWMRSTSWATTTGGSGVRPAGGAGRGAEQHLPDHFLWSCPFDLSDVMFITTANTTDTIPRPLLDRMEVSSCPATPMRRSFRSPSATSCPGR